MVRVLIAGLLAMVIAVVVGPKFIEWLRSQSIGQQVRAEANWIVTTPSTTKHGTPTMGGLLFLVAAIIPFLAFSLYTTPALVVLGVTTGCALIGFADDYLKVRRRRSLGLSARWKMLGLAALTPLSRSRSRTSTTSTPRSTSRSSTSTSTSRTGYYVVPLPRPGGHRERGQPDRRDRRARGRDGADLPADVSRDRGHRLDPVGRAGRAQRQLSRPRDRRPPR